MSFAYDATGNRVKKFSVDAAPGSPVVNTYYVYDATSTVVAIYEQNCAVEPPRPVLPPNIDGDTWPGSVDCQPGVSKTASRPTRVLNRLLARPTAASLRAAEAAVAVAARRSGART